MGRSLHACARNFVASTDSKMPPKLPAAQISTLSVNCSRIKVARCAPRALRIATSFCRAAPRATSRFETLRNPISSMQPTAQSINFSGFFTFPARSSFSERGATSSFTGSRGYCK